MKIRIKANSLRYRLTQSEVATLWSEGFLEERTEFSGKALIYAIVTGNEDTLSADFIEDRIVLNMPKTMIDELYHTDRVGFDDLRGPVSLLVEKDFVCKDKVEEDQSDNYPNPSIC
ncbi:MAG: hypothetical protein Q8918_08520 [Bacteroidota bacterium]|nr:hypothetical protein [Bacteroidota bacterium]MDP4212684.1 hypothetical protein [Bacteroidota bacterium]MDP4250137.1 hypothetical protein [Bacteroidota bacterium]